MMQANAVVMTSVGGPEVLQFKSLDIRWPRGPGDVLVRMKAAGVNPADTFFRALGTYVQGNDEIVLGHDGAGIVEAVGSEVKEFKIGDRVCFCNGGIGGDPGTYCELAVVPDEQLIHIPDGVEFHAAAAFPLVAITAWEALVERAGLAESEFVLIHGAAGGTGQIAVQLARLRGARIAATVSTNEKAELVTQLGAERPIVYRSENFVTATSDWTQGRGLDVAFDNIGPDVMTETYAAMAPYGRVVTLMGTPVDDDELNAYNRNLTIHNVMMLTPMWFGLKPRLRRQASIVRQLINHLATGEIVMRIEDCYPLSAAAKAHERLEAGGMSGKLVLEIGT